MLLVFWWLLMGDWWCSWFWEVLVERLGDEMWVGVTDDPAIASLYHHSNMASIRMHPR